ncbi:MAG: hypothetical protein EOO92_06140 [Pedobacter sp.]|nr:MAG: hypothetical protein EOO92_06140 [Pedobacter sp.]
MKRYIKHLLLLCFLGIGLKSFAQDTKVFARLDKASILLGDQTVLRLSAEIPANGKLTFPQLADTISAKISIVETGKRDTLKNDAGNWTISQAYTITSFDAGVQVIPAFSFTGNGVNLTTEPLPLQVQEVKVDTTKAIFDIKQPITVSYTFMDWLADNYLWVLLSLLLVIVMIGLWFYYKKRKKAAPVATPVIPAVPDHVVALDQLNNLRERKLWQQDQVKEYHSELADIVREFLEKRYRIRAMEQTSDEILSGLKHMELTAENRSRLKQILILADLVKFAKQKPLNTDNEQSMDNAIDFVKEHRNELI